MTSKNDNMTSKNDDAPLEMSSNIDDVYEVMSTLW